MLLITYLLAIAVAGVLITSLAGLIAGTFDVVSIVGAVICVAAALAIAIEVLWLRSE
jgi:phage-related protein